MGERQACVSVCTNFSGIHKNQFSRAVIIIQVSGVAAVLAAQIQGKVCPETEEIYLAECPGYLDEKTDGFDFDMISRNHRFVYRKAASEQ